MGCPPEDFKFCLAESKVTTLVDALRKAQHFIQATETCAEDEFNQQESQKTLGEDRDAQPDRRPKQIEERGGCFLTSRRNMLMEVQGSPMLW